MDVFLTSCIILQSCSLTCTILCLRSKAQWRLRPRRPRAQILFYFLDSSNQRVLCSILENGAWSRSHCFRNSRGLVLWCVHTWVPRSPSPPISKHKISFIIHNSISSILESCRRISIKWWMLFGFGLKPCFSRSSFCLWSRITVRENRRAIFEANSRVELCLLSQRFSDIVQQYQS